MQKIVVLGKKVSDIANTFCVNESECPIIIAESLNGAISHLEKMEGDTLIISRDFHGLEIEDLVHLSDNPGFLSVIWPADSLIEPFINHYIAYLNQKSHDEIAIYSLVEGSEMLLKENEELSGRVTALESVVRSLLSALSQYEPAAEAYADNADAWEIIMKTMPAADMMPEDTVPLEDDYDGDDDIMDDYSEEEE